jgi:ribosomal protein L33
MDKKDYNKNYYETNKAKIAEKLYCKETCPHCQKVVSHQNMKSHQKTS